MTGVNRRLVGVASFAAAVALVAGDADAAGFLLNDHGARATGRAGAVTATINNGAAIFYNPAGVAMAEGWNLYFGANLISPDIQYQELDGTLHTADSGASVVPNAYLIGRIADFIAAGVGVTAPYGSRISWPEGTPGTELVRSQTLRTLYISPVVAFNLAQWVPRLALGGGVDLVPASVELSRDIAFGADVGHALLAATAFGVGGRFGAMYHPDFMPGLSFGLFWRSEVNLDFTGNVDFDIAAPYRSSLPPDGEVSTSFVLPQFLAIGAAYRFGPIELELDLNYVNWRSFKEIDLLLPDGSHSITNKAYRDTVVFRAGFEFNIYQMDLDLRGGYSYDPSPVPAKTLDLSLPDIDRHALTVGGTYYLPHGMYIDVGLIYVLPGSRKTKPKPLTPLYKGDYRLSALVLSISLGFTYGADPRPVPPGFTRASPRSDDAKPDA